MIYRGTIHDHPLEDGSRWPMIWIHEFRPEYRNQWDVVCAADIISTAHDLPYRARLAMDKALREKKSYFYYTSMF